MFTLYHSICLQAHKKSVSGVCFIDKDCFATVSLDGSACIWQIKASNNRATKAIW